MDHQSIKYIYMQKELNIRQRRWLELVKNFDCQILNYPQKGKKVALSQFKVMHSTNGNPILGGVELKIELNT